MLADEAPELSNPEYGDYCIQAASVIVADAAARPDWLGVAPDGTDIGVVPAPRRAVMIAEQLAKRSYLNPNAVVAEGSVGPIGGDRTIEDFARTFELTEIEAEYLAEVKRTTGIVDAGSGTGGLWVLQIENRPYGADWATIYLPDVDPRALPWPVGTEGQDYNAYGGQ